MKILHVESGRHLYGGARQVAYIVAGLHAAGVENIVACPLNAALAQEVKDHALVLPLPMRGDVDAALYFRLKKIIAAHRPDIVHVHSRRGADIFGGLAAKRLFVPCVLSRRVDNPESKWIVRYKYRLYDHIIAISDAIRNVLIREGVPESLVTTVRSAVDPSPYAPPVDRALFCRTFDLPPNAMVVGIVAQLIPRKGHRYLFQAVDDLRHTFPLLRVVCFGQGADDNTLVSNVNARGINDIVRFAGFRADLPKWLGGLTILAHPADAEGLGVSLLQAAAAGVPIIASNAGGLPEAVQDGVTGLLIPPGDVTALKEALTRLLLDPALRERMGAAGKQRILTDFSIDTMIRGNVAVYEKVLKLRFGKK
ncbi:MAG: glycosyltransferase [Burkholderiales bacterium]|jgi:glycosyltransferase involved in cell wall biosynthesis|nr:glycosyltransferase [Burkholderiales bacterium]